MSQLKRPLTKGFLKKLSSPFCKDFINANMPAIKVTSLTDVDSNARHNDTYEDSRYDPYTDGSLLYNILRAIKISGSCKFRGSASRNVAENAYLNKIPLKDFINSLLPALSVSKEDDCFSVRKAISAEGPPSLFKRYYELLKELEYERSNAIGFSTTENAENLKKEYVDSVSSILPHSSLFRYDVLNCISLLLKTINLLSPRDCETYITENFPVYARYPFRGLDGSEVSFKIYSLLNNPLSSSDRSYVLDLLKKILSIGRNSIIGPYLPETPQSEILLASIFKTPKMADLFINHFINNNHLDKAVNIFSGKYASCPLQFDVSEKEILLKLLRYHETANIKHKSLKERRLTLPKLHISFALSEAYMRQHSLNKAEASLRTSYIIYLAFVRPALALTFQLQVETPEPLLIKIFNFLSLSSIESPEVVEDLLLLVKFFDFKVTAQTNLQVLRKVIASGKVSHACQYTWAYLNTDVSFVDCFLDVKANILSASETMISQPIAQAMFELIHKLISSHRIKEASLLTLRVIDRVLFHVEIGPSYKHQDSNSQLERMMTLGFPSFIELWELWGDLIEMNEEKLSTRMFLFLERSGNLQLTFEKVEFITPGGQHLYLEYQYLVMFDQMINNLNTSRISLPKRVVLLDEAKAHIRTSDSYPVSLDSLISCISRKSKSPLGCLIPC